MRQEMYMLQHLYNLIQIRPCICVLHNLRANVWNKNIQETQCWYTPFLSTSKIKMAMRLCVQIYLNNK